MTVFLIAGNAIFAILFVTFWTKYLSLKKSSDAKISTLKQTVEDELKEAKASENQLREGFVTSNKKIESLLQEVAAIRKEKEDEIKLRLETEKEVALAIQKAEDLQKRMGDWKIAQESAMKDSQNTIIKVGEDLYQKINASYQAEIANNKNIFAKVSEYIQKTSSASQSSIAVTSPEKIETPSAPTKTSNDLGKKLLSDLTQSVKESGHVEGKNYFLSSSFDAEKSKLFLCEAAFLQDSHFYILDFKACTFLSDYMQTSNKDAAQKSLIQKLDKYISYLNNPKYRAAILKAAASKNTKFNNGDIVVITPSNAELEMLESIGYLEKIEDTGVKVATFDEILDLTL